MKNKIKVLIADDEPMMRTAYRSLLDWERNGFVLSGCARNGKEALELVKKEGADIIITDLKMPIMSGLELISAVRAERSDIKFVVVSGFDDFHLVKEAYTLGASDYFLKFEIEPEVILGKLIAIADEIKEERRREDLKLAELEEIIRLQNLEKLVNSSQYAICEKLLKELMWSPNNTGLLDRMKNYGLEPTEAGLRVMVLTLCKYYEKGENEWRGEHELFKYALLNVLTEVCHKTEKCYVFCNLPNEYVVLMSNFPSEATDCARGLFRDIYASLRQCFSLECRGGISDVGDSFQELKNMYRTAKEASDYSFVAGNNELICYADVNKATHTLAVSERVLALKNALNSMNSDIIERASKTLVVEQSEIGCGQTDAVKNLYNLYLSELVTFAEAENIKEEAKQISQGYSEARQSDSLLSLNLWLTEALEKLSQLMAGEQIVIKAKSYIKAHYGEQITLSLVAKTLQISESHLSRLFAKVQKESFSQYLQRTRVNSAIELLRNSNMKIYEIAKEVGYTNSEQFSRMFKKVTGSSPKTYLGR